MQTVCFHMRSLSLGIQNSHSFVCRPIFRTDPQSRTVITYVHITTIVTVFATVYSITVVNMYSRLLPWLLAVIMRTTDFCGRASVAPIS